MKKIIALLFLACTWLQGTAQREWNESRWLQIITKSVPAGVHMNAGLHQLATLAMEDTAEANSRLRVSDYRHRDNKINIEIVYRFDENLEKITDRIDATYLRDRGFNVDQTWRNRASIWIGLNEILPKAGQLSADYFLLAVDVPRTDDEGPGVMNSTGYSTGSAPGGAGRRVAIFDGGFTSLQQIIDNGNAKTPAYVGIGGTSSSVAGVNFSGSRHGTAVVEMVYDHAPDATFEIYANGNITEKGAAVDDCIAHGVNVIAMSQSHYNQGWFDNTGGACAFVTDAANAGILFVTSCGNRAESHYEATFRDTDNDDRHEFSGTDESNNLNASVEANESTHVYLSWNTNAGTDFAIYLYRTSDNALLASSNVSGTTASAFESLSWTNTSNSAVGVYFRVVKVSGPDTEFEMFTHDAGTYQYATAAGSNTSPSNTTNLNVISVGAVSWVDYGAAPSATGVIMDYSSRGPTNSGNMAPKITGPTNTESDVYNGNFGGTSCATPNVAGAIVAFWSANPLLDATGVRQIMFRKAQLYKDWGAAGSDNVYGNGGLFLFTWASNLRYMFRTGTNAAVTNGTRPYYSMAVAQDLAPNNATVIILNNGNYTETGLYGTSGSGSGKRILYRSPFVGVNANFGF